MRRLTALSLTALTLGCGPLTDEDLDALATDEADLRNEVVINELTGGPSGWVELYNPRSRARDVGGWTVDDKAGASAPKRLPAGTKIPAHGRLVVAYAHINLTDKDEARLLDASGVVVDTVSNGWLNVSTRGKCYGRAPDGGAAQTGPLASCTKSDANPQPLPASTGACTGGTYGGVSFSRDEECRAVRFLDQASYSQLGAVGGGGARVAYDCGPTGRCGARTAAWAGLGQIMSFDRGGRCEFRSFSALKSAAAAWNGVARKDTVASTWSSRASYPSVTLERVYVAQAVTGRSNEPNGCALVKDSPDGQLYMTVCDRANHLNDGAPAAIDFRPLVGKWIWVRGAVELDTYFRGGDRWVLERRDPTAGERCGRLDFLAVVP